MQRLSVIKRALQLARGGEVSSITDIDRVLRREGYSDVTANLGGHGTRRQLRAKIAEARSADVRMGSDDEPGVA